MNKKNPNLTVEQKLIMFEDGTEPPGTSELNKEKKRRQLSLRKLWSKIIQSITKYESGSGWPSFYQSLPDVFETKNRSPNRLCSYRISLQNCNAHHGHIFDDGPQPTGKRYCNNGVCLVFKEKL